jgi:hypothetical protein
MKVEVDGWGKGRLTVGDAISVHLRDASGVLAVVEMSIEVWIAHTFARIKTGHLLSGLMRLTCKNLNEQQGKENSGTT